MELKLFTLCNTFIQVFQYVFLSDIKLLVCYTFCKYHLDSYQNKTEKLLLSFKKQFDFSYNQCIHNVSTMNLHMYNNNLIALPSQDSDMSGYTNKFHYLLLSFVCMRDLHQEKQVFNLYITAIQVQVSGFCSI